MKKAPLIFFITLLFFAFVLPADSQEMDPSFQIRDLKADFLATPTIDTAMRTKTSRRRTNWLEVEGSFSWQPRTKEEQADPFLDEITAEFHVLLETRTPVRSWALLNGTTTMQHVGAGNAINVAMYVSPRVMERLFGGRVPPNANAAVNNIALVLSRGGQVVSQRMLKGTEEFWKNPQLEVIPDMMMRKAETPFAHLAWDYFEHEKINP